MSRLNSPRRRYSPDHHQMGNHILFHNGSTAKMFPALSKLEPEQLAEMFNVPPTDRADDRADEVKFSEPYVKIPPVYRALDAPVRDEQQNRIIARGGVVSTEFTNRYNITGANGEKYCSRNATHGSRPGTSDAGGCGHLHHGSSSMGNSINGKPRVGKCPSPPSSPSSAATSPRIPMTPNRSLGGTQNAMGMSTSSTSGASNYYSRPATGHGTISNDGTFICNTIAVHGRHNQFKIHNETSAKDTLVSTAQPLNIRFDVDETLRQARLAELQDHYEKQAAVSSPPAPKQRRGAGEEGGNDTNNNSTTSSATRPKPAVIKPFTPGTEAQAKNRISNQWYLNSGTNALAIALQKLKDEERKIDRENRRVARMHVGGSAAQHGRRVVNNNDDAHNQSGDGSAADGHQQSIPAPPSRKL